MIVYKDILQEAERVRLAKALRAIMTVAGLFVTIAVISLLHIASTIRMVVLQNLVTTAVISSFVRWIFFYHLEFFQVLYRRRKYEFKSFHAKREIPLSIIIQVGMMITLFCRISICVQDIKIGMDISLFKECSLRGYKFCTW